MNVMSDILSQQPMPRKAKAKINRLLQSREITPNGVAFLVDSTDVFHDSPNASVGLPDGLGVKTVKKWIRKTVTISKPTTVTTPGWDLAVQTSPLTYMNQLSGAPTSNFMVPSTWDKINSPVPVAGKTARIYPGVTVNALENGGNLLASTVAQPFPDISLLASDWDSTHGGRVVAMGFEAHNVSPELTKQGSVMYARSPMVKSGQRQCLDGAGGIAPPITAVDGFNTASNFLVNDPATITREAKEGAYVCGVISRPTDQKPQLATLGSLVFIMQDGNTSCFAKASGISTPTEYQLENWNFSSAWFTGLGDDSKITLVAKYLIEELVGMDDTVFPFSTPSSSFDPTALEIYTRVSDDMPPGCAVSENPLGEWFNEIMDAVSEYAPKVLSSVPVVGGLLGSGVSMAAKAAGNYNKSAQAKEKVPKPPPLPKPKQKPPGKK